MGVNEKVFEAAKSGAVDAFTSYILGLEKTAQSRDEINSTPLHYAAANGHLDLVQIFLLNEADVNAVNDFGETPLHSAAGKGQVEVVKLLLSAKDVNLDLQTDEGWTALHLAAEKGHPAVVELLVRHGADVHIQDKGGEEAVEYAQSPEIAQVIVAAAPSHVDREAASKQNEDPVASSGKSEIDEMSPLQSAAGKGTAQEEEEKNSIGPTAEAPETEGEAEEGGENQFDTIEIELKGEQSDKTVEGSTAGAAAMNQCCVVM